MSSIYFDSTEHQQRAWNHDVYDQSETKYRAKAFNDAMDAIDAGFALVDNFGNFFYPDETALDQGVTGDSDTIKYYVDTAGADTATIYLRHNSGDATTPYTVTTAESIPANIQIIPENGALIDGAGTLTLDNPGQIVASPTQRVFGDSITVVFTRGGTGYPQWMGAPVNGTDNDLVACQRMADSMTGGGVLRLIAGDWTFTTMAAYTSANTGAENGQLIIANPISIKGDGRDHSVITSTLDDTYIGMIVVNGVNGVTIEDIQLKGTGTAFSSNYGGGIRVLLSSRAVVKNCHFEDLRGIGVNFVGNAGVAAGDTDVDYYCTYGICDGNTLRNINSDGIYHIYSKYNTTVNNVLYACGNTDSIIYEASDHSTIANNIVIYPNQRAILLNTGSSWSTVTGNTCYHYNATTVYDSILLASVKQCTVTGNVVRYSTDGADPMRGIVMDPGTPSVDPTYHNISGNTLINCGKDTDFGALHVQTGYNRVSDNMIEGGTYGIMVENDFNQIVNNYIKNSGQAIRLAGIDGRDDPTYTQIIGNFCKSDSSGIFVMSGCVGTKIQNNYMSVVPNIVDGATYNETSGNTPTTEVLTGTVTITPYMDSATIVSSGGAVTATLGSGYYVGQTKTIVMTEATTSSTVSITNHETSEDPEVATFDAVDETGVFMWTGTQWVTIFATCTFV